MQREVDEMNGPTGGGDPRSPRNAWMYSIAALALAIAGLGTLFFYLYPHFDLGPEQPIPFSHRVHAGVKAIDCRFCHPYVTRSQNAGMPPVEKCFFCHNYIIPMHPEIVKEREHYLKGEPVEWVKVFHLPDFTKFRHEPHLARAGLECQRCHGPVETMDRLQEFSFPMGFCIQCHRERNAPLDCWLACHR